MISGAAEATPNADIPRIAEGDLLMTEKIILAPGLNGNELTKSLALRDVQLFNTRICDGVELAGIALMRSGIAVEEEILDAWEETAYIAKAVKGNPYFGYVTYKDICDIDSAVRRMRSLAASDDESAELHDRLSDGFFPDKNKALLEVYTKYIGLLSDGGLIDSLMLIRKAAGEARRIDSEFVVLEEYPLTPLEKALLDKVSGGEYTTCGIADLFGVKSGFTKISEYRNCYGALNEIEMILDDIYSNHAVDECTVAVSDAETYGQLFYDYSLMYDIPVTFGFGIPIINSNPAKLLDLYDNWMTGGFFGSGSVNKMLHSSAFDREKLREELPDVPEKFKWGRFYGLLGQIRLTNDALTNDVRIRDLEEAVEEDIALSDEDRDSIKECIPLLKVMAKELALSTSDFIEKYAYIRKGSDHNLDVVARRTIKDQIGIMRAANADQSMSDIIGIILKLSVLKQSSSEGKIHLTSISGAVSCVRDNLYIAGLSALKYPGAVREDYLLLDDDLNKFGPEAARFTSKGKNDKKKKDLFTLVHLATGLNADIKVSYSGLNVSELKRENASSLIYELYKDETGGNVTSKELKEHIVDVGYFDPRVSAMRLIGKAYSEGKTIKGKTASKKDAPLPKQTLERAYSPSALDMFYSCPKRFFLSYILKIRQPDDERLFDVIAANDKGTLAHVLMETLADSDLSREDFLTLSGETFDRYIKEHPPVIGKKVEQQRINFLKMMQYVFDTDPGREVVLKEEDVSFAHPGGVKLHGFPDRVEKLPGDTYQIVDFKTGSKQDHVAEDLATCIQVLVYAFLMEQKGLSVSECEYRFINIEKKTHFDYDDAAKEILNNKLNEFKTAMENGNFTVNATAKDAKEGDPDPCKYCKYGLICGKEEIND